MTFMTFSFVDIMDIHILEKESGKKWLNHCPRHIMRPCCLGCIKKLFNKLKFTSFLKP